MCRVPAFRSRVFNSAKTCSIVQRLDLAPVSRQDVRRWDFLARSHPEVSSDRRGIGAKRLHWRGRGDMALFMVSICLSLIIPICNF
jgi:hypothetical protein